MGFELGINILSNYRMSTDGIAKFNTAYIKPVDTGKTNNIIKTESNKKFKVSNNGMGHFAGTTFIQT